MWLMPVAVMPSQWSSLSVCRCVRYWRGSRSESTSCAHLERMSVERVGDLSTSVLCYGRKREKKINF
jgi:hypothetical protein